MVIENTETYDLDFESEIWRFLYGNKRVIPRRLSERKRVRLKKIEVFARELYEPVNGPFGDLRRFVEIIAAKDFLKPPCERFYEYLPQFHPGALKFLVKFGKEQKPILLTEKLFLGGEQVPGECCTYAFTLMHTLTQANIPTYYCEGLAVSTMHFPMLHAWNATYENPTLALDGTFYASSRWGRYWGISITADEHKKAWALIFPECRGTAPLIFARDHWNPRVEAYLTDVLCSRM